MTKTAILLPYPAQQEQIIRMTEKVRSLDVMCVERAHTETVVRRGRELEEKGCELIIARGVQAQLLRENVTIPLVEMKVTTQEMGLVIRALRKQVGTRHPKIGLVGYSNMFGNTDHYDELFDIRLAKYMVTENDQLVTYVDRAAQEGCEAIIGGDTACERAQELGIPSFKIPAGMESLSNALETAERVSYAIELAKTNNAEMDVMLSYTFTGIMQVDNDGVIKRINRSGHNFLERYLGDPVGKRVQQVIPSIRRKVLDDALIQGKEGYSIYVNSQKMEIVVNVAPIRIDNRIQGAVLTFQEGRRIIEMDTELHKELYQRGFIANFTLDQLYAGSKETKNLEQYVRKISQYQAPVLILGEKGSGAEFLAQAIHNASPLSKSAFVPVDCDAWMPETLDDMLFGSYTSRQGTPPCLAELAADGTLYLNGVEMLSRESQYKMLNLIRGKFMHNGSHRVSFTKVRVIASTSVNLAAKVEKGEFRQDLYYALSSLSTEIPPLRHQKEYTLFWFNHYIDQWQKQYKRYIHMTQGALRFVQEYDWPGNLEQMASVTERIVLLTEKRSIDEGFVKKQMEQILPDILPGTEKVVLYKDKEAVRIAELLKKHGGNREKVAAELGISKTTLWRRIKKYGIEKDFSF
ncbi:MAG: sigma 54-interacting transcriptional regulator [Lachnospiraceae bacterium]|nr:sigma 54-interacting transcriptional regulator [Lachnospiraceae bacterium]